MKCVTMTPKNPLKIVSSLGAAVAIASLSGAANAKDFELSDGWTGHLGLQLQTFLINVDDNVNDISSQRVLSGFDPSKLTIGATAPEYNGVTPSGTIQLVQAINADKRGGDDSFNGENGGQFQVRVAELAIAGDFGTVKMGRGWAIFGSSSLLHDSGSLPGIGRGGSVDGGGGTAGRINYGYYYPDFHPGIQYASNDFGGLSFRVGLFDPSDIKDDPDTDEDEAVRAESVRFEGEVNYNTDAYDLWASFINTSTEGDAKQSGFDIGGEVRFGSSALTAAFSDGEGVSCCGPSEQEFQQWYVEADTTVGSTTFGVSYGENEAKDVSEGELTMLFVHHALTPELTLVAEFNNQTETNTETNEDTVDKDTIGFGANWQF